MQREGKLCNLELGISDLEFSDLKFGISDLEFPGFGIWNFGFGISDYGTLNMNISNLIIKLN